ncbi:MAG: VWA domain-containing protein [Epsilonproteobacteria bacterium]|nr:VWA domain-containing protein [Campylobacterota bacterium]
MEFLNPYAFILLGVIPLFWFVKNSSLPFSKRIAQKLTLKAPFSSKKRFVLLLISYVFAVLALARPILPNSSEKIKAPQARIAIILNLSKQALQKDLYPNRFKAYTNKLKALFSKLKGQNILIIAAKEHPYLIIPPTNDYQSAIYLLNHISPYAFSDTANIKAALKAAKEFNPDYTITLLNKHFMLNNKKIPFSYSNTDIDKLLTYIKPSTTRTVTINQKELFFYPLSISTALFILGGL